MAKEAQLSTVHYNCCKVSQKTSLIITSQHINVYHSGQLEIQCVFIAEMKEECECQQEKKLSAQGNKDKNVLKVAVAVIQDLLLVVQLCIPDICRSERLRTGQQDGGKKDLKEIKRSGENKHPLKCPIHQILMYQLRNLRNLTDNSQVIQ